MRRNILIAIALIATQVSIAQVLTIHSIGERLNTAAIKSTETDQNAQLGGIIEYNDDEKPVTVRKEAALENAPIGGITEYNMDEKPVTIRKSAELDNASIGGITEYNMDEKPVTIRKTPELDNASIGGITEYNMDEKPVTIRKSAELDNASIGGITEYNMDEKPVTIRKSAELDNASIGGITEYNMDEKPVTIRKTADMLNVESIDDRGDEEDPNVIRGVGLDAKVYPNPFDNTFTVHLAADVPFAHVKVVSPYGKVVEERMINEEGQFDLNGLDLGVYVVQLSNSREMIMKRIIKR